VEAADSFMTVNVNQTKQCHILEDNTYHTDCSENLLADAQYLIYNLKGKITASL
jgi:hypothetical protein